MGHDWDCSVDARGYNFPGNSSGHIHSPRRASRLPGHRRGSQGRSVRRNEMAGVLSASSTVGKRKAHPLIRIRERGFEVDVAGTILLLLVGLALSAWCLITCGRLNLPGAFFFLLYPWTVNRTGRLVTPRLGVEPVLGRSFPFRFLVGFTVLTLAQFLAHTLLPGSLAAHFLILAALVEMGWFLRRRQGTGRGPERHAPTPAEMLLVVLCLLAATCWSRGLLVSVVVRGDQVVFHNWSDYLEHANIVARFLGGKGLWGMGNYALTGLPAPLYHYAGYLPAATAAVFTGSTALDAVLSTWNPLGNVLIGLAAYTLVLPWAGRRGGSAPRSRPCCSPTPPITGPPTPYLRPHWLQQIGCARPLWRRDRDLVGRPLAAVEPPPEPACAPRRPRVGDRHLLVQGPDLHRPDALAARPRDPLVARRLAGPATGPGHRRGGVGDRDGGGAHPFRGDARLRAQPRRIWRDTTTTWRSNSRRGSASGSTPRPARSWGPRDITPLDRHSMAWPRSASGSPWVPCSWSSPRPPATGPTVPCPAWWSCSTSSCTRA